MSIANQIILRYRADGHVRFALPKELCEAQAAQQLENRLRQVEGIYRVELNRRQGKLSIRYIEGVTHLKAVAQALFEAIAHLEANPAGSVGSNLAKQEGDATDWLHDKFTEAKETLTALGIVARNAGKSNRVELIPDKEKFALEFFTDILVLYLIKLHWHLIMGHWIKNPWQYRSEWMATIYMVFLLVRSKKPKK